MKDERKFWMVWHHGESPPTKRHETHSSALEEARRLAAKHGGHIFYVLAAEKGVCFETQPPPVTEWAMH